MSIITADQIPSFDEPRPIFNAKLKAMTHKLLQSETDDTFERIENINGDVSLEIWNEDTLIAYVIMRFSPAGEREIDFINYLE